MAQRHAEVGIVRKLTRYPVKSMAGEDLVETQVGHNGLEGDRRFALLNPEDKSGFPWVTARDYPALVRYQPYFVDPANIRESAVRVKTADGLDWPIDSPDLLDKLGRESGKPAQLLQLPSGAFDATSISLLSMESLQSLAALVGNPLDGRQFRANITIEARPYLAQEFPEESFVGGVLMFGEGQEGATVRVLRKDVRCMMVNIHPDTAEQNPAVLKAIVDRRNREFGVYGTTERPGRIKVGDVLRWSPA